MVVRSGGDIEARFARGPTEGTYLAGCLEKAIALVPYDQLVSAALPAYLMLNDARKGCELMTATTYWHSTRSS
jgi:hypothetical protein